MWIITTKGGGDVKKEKEKRKTVSQSFQFYLRTFEICLKILRIFTFTHTYPHGKPWKKGKYIPLQLSCKKGKWWSLTLTLTENFE